MKGSNSKQNKSLNLRLLLSEIATQGPLSRADLARATQLTKQTITNLVDDLIRYQLVIETGQLKVGVGKPSTMLMLNSRGVYSVAVRLWPERVEVALCDLGGQFIDMMSAARPPFQPVAEQVQQLLQTLLTNGAIAPEQLLAVGLTLVSGEPEPAIRQQQLSQLQQQLASRLLLPVCAANTAAACAAYQLLHGEAQQLQSFCYVHIGQQIDCALVFHRQLLAGRQGLTGALGEIFVTPDQDQHTGDFGRLNDFASVSSLQRFVDKKWPGVQLDSSSAFAELAKQPDKLTPWLEQATEPLRVAIHTLESLFNCQAIIIGGEVSTWFLDKLISRLRPLIPSISQFGSRDVPRLIKTPQVERIALHGLAALPLHHAIRPDQASSVLLPLTTAIDARQQLLFGDPQDTTEELNDDEKLQ